MVASANPYATEAGLEMLRAGGSAADAAVAVQAVLTLVEPQSSGIGGGAFLLYWDEGGTHAYDGRETAPAGATSALFLNADGTPLFFPEAVVGGISIGVPGVLAMLARAHEAHGRLPWDYLFAPAIRLARDGFVVSPRLHGMLAADPVLSRLPPANALFFADGRALAPGTTLKNPALAAALEKIAEDGAAAFYEGALAEDIVRTVQNAPRRPGTLALSDLKAYEAKERAALCRPYRRFRICTMPPPTSGGITLLQILGILEAFDMAAHAPDSAQAVHLFSEAARIAYADRALYIADPDFVDVPVDAMLAPDYLRRRAAEIDPTRAADTITPGQFASLAPHQGRPLPSTTHFSIIDASGNALAMTSSVEGAFGSHLMSNGFFLNNQLTDFSFLPVKDGRAVANAVAAGKRPRSSMSPVLVFDEGGHLYATLGSPGGPRIIAYVAQTLIALLDHKMTMQDAIALPRHTIRGDVVELEEGTQLVERLPVLRAMGHEVRARALTSGLHGIRRTQNGLDGGADPRREGNAKSLTAP